MKEWDPPIYKRLAASELGAGHTSGIVPTTDTQGYFGVPKSSESHLISKIVIEFWSGNKSKIITTNVNYFKSDTHDHIHLTGNLLPTYKDFGAEVGDIIVLWKSKNDETYFKGELIKKNTPRWLAIGSGWVPDAGGSLSLLPPPINSAQDTYGDGESQEYEIPSDIEETITKDDFPTTERQGRVLQKERHITIRNKAKGDFVLKQQGYKCQVDEEHTTFTTPNGFPYMEKHHLISMKFYENFENDLDDISNIVSLCPNCHRKIHLGTNIDREKLLEILFKKHETKLRDAGFKISFDELKRCYNII
jgi:hypothetical protein